MWDLSFPTPALEVWILNHWNAREIPENVLYLDLDIYIYIYIYIYTHTYTRSVAYGIFPGQGLNPCPLHLQADS